MADIDLGEYRSHGAKVFSGRERGREVREGAELEELEEQGDTITILVPDDAFAVTSSFFLGMFGSSIRKYGREGFKEKYNFEGPIVDEVIEDGIQEALRKEPPLEA